MEESDSKKEFWGLNEELEQALDDLIINQKDDIKKLTPNEFKNHQLPLARVKKIMKTDEDVKMISSETPALFAKACEMFIIEITRRAWVHTDDNKRRTLQKSDVADCIHNTIIFDFLVDVLNPGNISYN
jgi:nuclear transcription factor Y gamma